MTKHHNSIVALCVAAASFDLAGIRKAYGPDLTVLPGEVGEIIIDSLQEDESKGGYTAVVRGGGVLSLRLTPVGQKNRREITAVVLDDAQRDKLLHLLATWPNTTCSLRRHAKSQGLLLPEIRRAFFQNKGRTQPPLRSEYERARELWRHAYNARRAK